MEPTYEIRLMSEWGGACLWGMNEAAKADFGYAEIERVLPLSARVKTTLDELSKLHDSALDWNDSGGPSPWSQPNRDQFEEKANAVLQDVRAEQGPRFIVWYDQL